jgi:type I restriction enzyme S subunit
MITVLKPYPVMKDSGVPWLGEVPEHWDVRRGKWLFRHRKQINTDRSNSNVLSLTLRGVVNNDPDNPEGLVPKDYATYQLFRKGDLVFKLIDLENLRTSRVGLVHEDGIMSSAYVRLTPQKVIDIRFFYQQYSDLYQRGIYNQLGAGVRSTLGPTDLLDLSMVVPPLPEQAAIVRFLDHMERRIRKYIRAKQKLIKLLEEQKQAIIHRAVTRGLDANIRLKPSGLEWLGDVPEHWEVLPLKRVSQIIDGDRGSEYPNVEDFVAQGVPFLSSKSIKDGRLTFDNSPYISDEKFQKLREEKMRPGDLVMTVRGTIGNSALFSGDLFKTAFINAQMMILRPNINRILSSYFLKLTQSRYFNNLLAFRAYGSAQQQLTNQLLSALPLPLPPIEEQEKILIGVTALLRTADTALDRTHSEIALLREYRTRLIADVVTGKLDVREVTGRLPDKAEEPELVDEGDTMSAGDEEPVDDLDTVQEEVEA